MPIIVVWLILIFFGIMAIYSVSIHESFTLTLSLWDPSNYFYFYRQLRNLLIWFLMSGIVYILPIKFFQKEKNITIISVVLMVLQLLVFIPWLWVVLNWARWWIDIPFLPSIQPAEFFKLGYVLFLGSRLLRKQKMIHKKEFYTFFIALNSILFVVFLLIPDLWTVLILWIVWLIMCWYAWAKIKHIILMLLGWLLLWLVAWSIAWMASDRFQYIQKRFTYFLSSDIDPQSRQIWWQNQQALIAIWWWGLFGKWYGKWLQKFWYIPEAQSDFIFSAISEEIWFFGGIVLLGLYFYLFYYFLSRLHYVKDPYNKMIWVWIVSLIVVQVFVNLWVNLKILPNTWLTLPFISYWWTALMVNMIEIILLYKILKWK